MATKKTKLNIANIMTNNYQRNKQLLVNLLKISCVYFYYCVPQTHTHIYRVGQKSKPQTLFHIFTKMANTVISTLTPRSRNITLVLPSFDTPSVTVALCKDKLCSDIVVLCCSSRSFC